MKKRGHIVNYRFICHNLLANKSTNILIRTYKFLKRSSAWEYADISAEIAQFFCYYQTYEALVERPTLLLSNWKSPHISQGFLWLKWIFSDNKTSPDSHAAQCHESHRLASCLCDVSPVTGSTQVPQKFTSGGVMMTIFTGSKAKARHEPYFASLCSRFLYHIDLTSFSYLSLFLLPTLTPHINTTNINNNFYSTSYLLL